MIYFNNDYSEGCLPQILQELNRTNMDQTPGYGMDDYCRMAADTIRTLCQREDANVHFLVGGTQTNLTVIAAALRPHQGVIAATTGHISVHETGAIEATGHKVIELPCTDGKLTADQISEVVAEHNESTDAEHMVQPKMVYISSPTELGTLYTLQELTNIRRVCDEFGLLLFFHFSKDKERLLSVEVKYCIRKIERGYLFSLSAYSYYVIRSQLFSALSFEVTGKLIYLV